MIKTIFFDFWGTIVENGVFPSPARQVKDILGFYRTPFSHFIVDFETALMTRKFKDLYEGFTAVCEKFNIPPQKERLDVLVGMWNKNTILSKPFPETIKVIEELNKDYKIVIISNTDCFSLNAVVEKYDLLKYFKKIFQSYELGMLKTNPEMFNIAVKKLRAKHDECIMVGDSVESDILAAKAAGIRSILVDRHNMRDFKNKIINLEQLNSAIKQLS